MIAIIIVIGIVAAQSPPEQRIIDHTQDCNTYRDCYKCVLSNCGWRWDFNESAGIDACYDTNEDYNRTDYELNVTNLFSFARTCRDPLNLCKVAATSDNFNLTMDLTGSPSRETTIPESYFCIFTLPQSLI